MVLSFSVTAALFAMVVAIGFRLGRYPKPYPPDLLILHVAPFFMIVLGIGECMKDIDAVHPGESVAMSASYLAGPALLALFVSGVAMSLTKRKRRAWMFVHKVAMYFLGFSIVASGILAAAKW